MTSAHLRNVYGLCALACAFTFGSNTLAKPGTHGPAVSTWDLRASSVSLGFKPGFLDGGFLHIGTYNANFSSTGGTQSAQFGLHYLLFRPEAGAKTGHGVSGSAVSVFSYPLTKRYDEGTPGVALGFFVGVVPTAIISGNLNYMSVPLPLGLGLPLSPHPAFTVTPWIEIAPSVDVENVIRTTSVGDFDPETLRELQASQETNVPLSSNQVESVLTSGVELETTFNAGMRAGIDFALNLSETTSVQVGGMLGSQESFFGGTVMANVGASLAWRWDNIVPAVLPASRRLMREDCEDIERRFMACPSYPRAPLPPDLHQQQTTPQGSPRATEPKKPTPPLQEAPPAQAPGAPPNQAAPKAPTSESPDADEPAPPTSLDPAPEQTPAPPAWLPPEATPMPVEPTPPPG